MVIFTALKSKIEVKPDNCFPGKLSYQFIYRLTLVAHEYDQKIQNSLWTYMWIISHPVLLLQLHWNTVTCIKRCDRSYTEGCRCIVFSPNNFKLRLGWDHTNMYIPRWCTICNFTVYGLECVLLTTYHRSNNLKYTVNSTAMSLKYRHIYKLR